jgi:antitoxin (DNA-binding transcriptional repressor) of toxin-antitoxin stability system
MKYAPHFIGQAFHWAGIPQGRQTHPGTIVPTSGAGAHEHGHVSILALDMAKLLAYILAMKTVNIGELKDNLSKFINFVEQGEVIQICKRNIPIALLVPHGSQKKPNRTQLGCGIGTLQVKGDLTEPLIPEESWEMLR